MISVLVSVVRLNIVECKIINENWKDNGHTEKHFEGLACEIGIKL